MVDNDQWEKPVTVNQRSRNRNFTGNIQLQIYPPGTTDNRTWRKKYAIDEYRKVLMDMLPQLTWREGPRMAIRLMLMVMYAVIVLTV